MTTTLADIDRVYHGIPIPIRARRVMRDIANADGACLAELYRRNCRRALDPSMAEYTYLVRYLISRELVRHTLIGSRGSLTLIPPCERTDSARTFDQGERECRKRLSS
jgi:hypothetical protein